MNNPFSKSQIRMTAEQVRMTNDEIRKTSECRMTRATSVAPFVGFRASDFILHSCILLILLLAASSQADIPEPDTLFYGKIVNRTSQQEYLINNGTLSWVVSRPDGKQITLSTQLSSLNNGIYSYSLRVPHEALVFGLTVSSNSVPLTIQSASCSHLAITVDGAVARIMAPGSSTFIVSQAARSSTYRLDLELFTGLPDTTGDGTP